jgi:hypothetical protein
VELEDWEVKAKEAEAKEVEAEAKAEAEAEAEVEVEVNGAPTQQDHCQEYRCLEPRGHALHEIL